MAKYIDADRLKAEIERRKGYISVTHFAEELLSFIDSLKQEQPSLPSNLDEAAKRIVIQLHPCMEYSSILGDHLTMGELVELVKAGANWHKAQMLKDAVDGKVVNLADTYDDLTISVEGKELNEALQPLGVKDGDKVKVIIVPEKEDKK